MGIGKVFAGLSVAATWIVINFGIIQNKAAMEVLVPSATQRDAIVATFNAIQSVIWVIVVLISLGLIIWGLKE